jgi:two-component system, NarL family, response regulator NreC
MLSIIIADDHTIVRAGVRLLLEREPDLRVVDEVATGDAAIRRTVELRPDVLVLDLSMPGVSGFEVARKVRARSPDTRIVVLSMHANESYVHEALHSGALAYVLKEATGNELVRAIRCVASGRQFLSAPFSAERLRAYAALAGPQTDAYDRLTARERTVLQFVAEGHTNVEIGALLSVSARTVEAHRARLLSKLGLHGQQELLRYALRRGLITLDS